MKYITTCLMVLFLLGCNAAVDGFNAPVGSTIAFTPPEQSWVACGSTVAFTKVSALVNTANSISGEFEPTQNIFGQIFAQGPTGLYVKAENAEILEPLASQVSRIDSDSLTFTTNRRGLYEFVVGNPGALPGESYTDCVSVFLGVSSADFCITVDCPATVE